MSNLPRANLMLRYSELLLAFSFLFSKILGLLRDNLLAASFGVRGGEGIFNLDTYYAAFRLPDLLFNLLSYGILSAAFVPIFIEVLEKKGREKAFHFANEILHAFSIAIIGISFFLFLFTPQLLRIFVPGFSEHDFQVTIKATRLMLITPLFFTIGSIAGGVQNALHKFFGMAAAPLLYNIGIIIGIFFLSKSHGVYGVAIGVSIGAFFHMLVQLASLWRMGFRYEHLSWRTLIFSQHVRAMIFLALPRIFGMSVTQISLLIDTLLASLLPLGSITIINFASNLGSLPLGIIAASVATASFGTLSIYAAQGNLERLGYEISFHIRRILFFLIPFTLGLFSLRFEIVNLLLGRGKFTPADGFITANTFAIFLTGLSFGGLVFLLTKAFYALKNTKIPVLITLLAVFTNIVIGFLLTRVWHFHTYGLAFANATASIINAVFLLILLQKKIRLHIFDASEIIKFIISAVLMIFSMETSNLLMRSIHLAAFAKLLFHIILSSAIGMIVYFGMCWLLKCKSIKKPEGN